MSHRRGITFVGLSRTCVDTISRHIEIQLRVNDSVGSIKRPSSLCVDRRFRCLSTLSNNSHFETAATSASDDENSLIMDMVTTRRVSTRRCCLLRTLSTVTSVCVCEFALVITANCILPRNASVSFFLLFFSLSSATRFALNPLISRNARWKFHGGVAKFTAGISLTEFVPLLQNSNYPVYARCLRFLPLGEIRSKRRKEENKGKKKKIILEGKV